jgi:hypothetical protein
MIKKEKSVRYLVFFACIAVLLTVVFSFSLNVHAATYSTTEALVFDNDTGTLTAASGGDISDIAAAYEISGTENNYTLTVKGLQVNVPYAATTDKPALLITGSGNFTLALESGDNRFVSACGIGIKTFNQGIGVYPDLANNSNRITGFSIINSAEAEGTPTLTCAGSSDYFHAMGIWAGCTQGLCSFTIGENVYLTATGTRTTKVENFAAIGFDFQSDNSGSSLSIGPGAVINLQNSNGRTGSAALAGYIPSGILNFSVTDSIINITSDDVAFGVTAAASSTYSLSGSVLNIESGTIDQDLVSKFESTDSLIMIDDEWEVAGDVTLSEDLIIPADTTLTIPETGSLTVPAGVTLTNNGTIDSDGMLINTGTLTNSGAGSISGDGAYISTGILNANDAITLSPASDVATISAYSLGGVTNGTLGTPKSTYNDSEIIAGAVTLTSAQATSAAFSATLTDSDSTVKYAYTSTDSLPSFGVWSNTTVANEGYVWIEVTAQDRSTKLIYKIALTVTAPPTYIATLTVQKDGSNWNYEDSHMGYCIRRDGDGVLSKLNRTGDNYNTYTASVPNGTYSVYEDWSTDIDTGVNITISDGVGNATLNYYTVSFESNGGSSVDSQIVFSSGQATEPTPPTLSGYTFKGWSTDDSSYSAYVFTTAVTAADTLYAFWDVVNAAAPIISVHPQGASYTENESATALSVTANSNDSGELSYQWYSNSSDDNTTGSPIGSETNQTYTPPTTSIGTVYYYCIVTNTKDVSGTDTATAASNTAAIVVSADEPVTPVINISGHPQGTTVTAGSISGSLSVTASSTPTTTLSYQWYRAISALATDSVTDPTFGTNSDSFTIPDTLTPGNYYYYVVVSAVGAIPVQSSVATITVQAAAPTYTAVTGITGVPTTATTGVALTLSGTVAPSGATNNTIVWSVSAADAGTTGASVVGNSFTATTAGTATITATITNGATAITDYTQDFNVTVSDDAPIVVPVAVTGVTLSGTQTATVGDVIYLTATVLPTNADNKGIMWDSTNPGVASVSGGMVNALSEGTTVITVTTADGGYTDTLTITVNPVYIPPYTPPYNPPSYPTYTPPSYPIFTPAPTYDIGYTTPFISKSGITASVTVTEAGIIVEAGINDTGSVNSESTVAATREAARIAKINNDTSITVTLPEGTIGLSAATVQKLVRASGGLDLVISFDSITLPLTSETGQILTELYFETERIYIVQNYIAERWNTDILGAFETAQKGGWSDTATISVSMDKLGFSADDGTKLYAIIYDTKAKKWYQVAAEVVNGEIVIKTKRSGIITIVTDSVK